MTFTETANAMRRLADGMDRVVRQRGDAEIGHAKPTFEGDMAVGAAVMLTYIRDLVTTSERPGWSQGVVLVLLEMISRDGELFPCGVGKLMWDAEEEDGE